MYECNVTPPCELFSLQDEVELSVEPTDEPKDVLAKNNQQVQIELELSLNEVR